MWLLLVISCRATLKRNSESRPRATSAAVTYVAELVGANLRYVQERDHSDTGEATDVPFHQIEVA
jgi:hypothetical protein